MLVRRPYTVADESNPKLISPCRGPFTVRSKLSPLIYRVARDGELAETSVRLGRIKAFHNDASSFLSDFTALDDSFRRTTLPVPDVDGSVPTVHIGRYSIEAIEGYKRGPDKASRTSVQYHSLVKNMPSNLGIWRKVNVVLHCHEMIRAYRLRILAEDPHAFDPPKS